MTETYVVARTCLETHIVSTVKRSELVTALDTILGLTDDILDRVAQLSAPGDYETMVFDSHEEEIIDWEERDFARYGTEEAALLGHEAMVKKWEKQEQENR